MEVKLRMTPDQVLEQAVKGMRQHFGLKAIDAIIVSHMHGDHFLEALYLREKWGAQMAHLFHGGSVPRNAESVAEASCRGAAPRTAAPPRTISAIGRNKRIGEIRLRWESPVLRDIRRAVPRARHIRARTRRSPTAIPATPPASTINPIQNRRLVRERGTASLPFVRHRGAVE